MKRFRIETNRRKTERLIQRLKLLVSNFLKEQML